MEYGKIITRIETVDVPVIAVSTPERSMQRAKNTTRWVVFSLVIPFYTSQRTMPQLTKVVSSSEA